MRGSSGQVEGPATAARRAGPVAVMVIIGLLAGACSASPTAGPGLASTAAPASAGSPGAGPSAGASGRPMGAPPDPAPSTVRFASPSPKLGTAGWSTGRYQVHIVGQTLVWDTATVQYSVLEQIDRSGTAIVGKTAVGWPALAVVAIDSPQQTAAGAILFASNTGMLKDVEGAPPGAGDNPADVATIAGDPDYGLTAGLDLWLKPTTTALTMQVKSGPPDPVQLLSGYASIQVINGAANGAIDFLGRNSDGTLYYRYIATYTTS